MPTLFYQKQCHFDTINCLKLGGALQKKFGFFDDLSAGTYRLTVPLPNSDPLVQEIVLTEPGI